MSDDVPGDPKLITKLDDLLHHPLTPEELLRLGQYSLKELVSERTMKLVERQLLNKALIQFDSIDQLLDAIERAMMSLERWIKPSNPQSP